MRRLNYSITESSVVVFIDGEVYTISSNHPNYREIIQVLLDDTMSEFNKIYYVLGHVDVAASIEKYADGRITIEGDTIMYNGMDIPMEVLAERILKLRGDESSFEHLVKFLDNLMANPSTDSRDDLYRFLSRNNLPITNRGTFLAYKKVNINYKDVHSNTFDNSIGAVVSMPRAHVDPDRNNTCSAGFHAASYDYMDSYGGDRVVIVEIDPKDVVSVPVDHDDAKLRCCKYTVIGEIENYQSTQIRSGYVDVEQDDDFFEDDTEDETDVFDDYYADESEWDGQFNEDDEGVRWISNGAEKIGEIVDYIEAGNSLKTHVKAYLTLFEDEGIDATLTKKVKDVSSKDRYLVKVNMVDGTPLNKPKLYAPNVEQVETSL